MVMPNLYGNIVSNIGAGLVGGAGVCPGRNIGHEYVLFEQGARHTGLDLAFQNTANPTAMLLSSIQMLKHLGWEQKFPIVLTSTCIVCSLHRLRDHAARIETAIYDTIYKSKVGIM